MIFEIFTPGRQFLNGEAISVTFPCTDGELCVMKDHMPLAASLKSGILKIRSEKETTLYKIEEGFTEVKNNAVIIFVNNIERI